MMKSKEKNSRDILILDTNMIVAPLRYDFNLTSELERLNHFEITILSCTLVELKKLTEKEQRFALKLLKVLDPAVILFKNKKIIKEVKFHEITFIDEFFKKIEEQDSYCDDIIVQFCKKNLLQHKSNNKLYVATMDKELIKRLKSQNCFIITLRSNHLIQIT